MPDPLSNLPKLGVGISFQGAMLSFVTESLDHFDFVEIIPDSLWNNRGQGADPRYEEKPETLEFLDWLSERKPLVGHSIGLSIGSADHFDRGHVAQIRRWQQRYRFPWHSDHLSFNRLDHVSGHTMDMGFTMPVPYDQPVLEMLAEKVRYVQSRVPVPFLLENNVYYFDIPEQEMSEPEFLSHLTRITGCGLLLDLHNIHVNSRNHGFDAWEFLQQLDLSRVVEIHLAGGMERDGVYLDSHSGPCPPEVWDLFDKVVPRAPNLSGVVFEVFGSYFERLEPGVVLAEVERARESFPGAPSSSVA
jgi:uncharacterized protein (UPF0276 family)